jgi:hypothetical protein
LQKAPWALEVSLECLNRTSFAIFCEPNLFKNLRKSSGKTSETFLLFSKTPKLFLFDTLKLLNSFAIIQIEFEFGSLVGFPIRIQMQKNSE